MAEPISLEAHKPERQVRNMVQRIDGRMVNAGTRRGMLSVCATGCCCGRTERGFAPVPTDLYHDEWERRKLRNKVHLNQGGCLGPCPLANVTLLMLDGRPYWFHSLNDEALIVALYDYIERLLAVDDHVVPPSVLAPHIFNGFSWDGSTTQSTEAPISGTMAQNGARVKGVPMFPGQKAVSTQLAPIDIVFLSQADTDLLALAEVQRQLPQGFAPLRLAHIGRLADENAVDVLLGELLPTAAVVVAKLHGARSFMHGLAQLEVWAEATEGFLLCLPAVEALDPELMARSTVGVPLAHLISAYFQAGGVTNLTNGLSCLSDHLLLTGWGYDSPRELPRHGIYQPQDAYATEGNAGTMPMTGAQPVVGILFYRAHLLSGNIAFVDAILTELHAQGITGRAVYTQSLKECDADGTPIAINILRTTEPIDAIISTLSFALGDLDQMTSAEHESVLQALGVPIVQAITASGSRDQWVRSGRGLGPLDTAMNVAIPEFDGRIIGVPISFKEQDVDDQRGAMGAARYVPDLERIQRLVGIVQRQIALRHKPNAEKRIAFVFTNQQRQGATGGQCRRAGCARLTPVAAGKNEGGGVHRWRFTDIERSIALDLIDRCSYDETWLTEAQLAQAYSLSSEQYGRWFAELPTVRRAEMEQQWGEAPGKAYVHEGALRIPGIEFGNTFVALQPPRGYDMDANAIYHRLGFATAAQLLCALSLAARGVACRCDCACGQAWHVRVAARQGGRPEQ